MTEHHLTGDFGSFMKKIRRSPRNRPQEIPQSDGNAEEDRDDDDDTDDTEELLYKVPNVFASDGPRYIFFLTHHIY